MLRALSIRRIVIVDALDLEFDAGLMTLTGETGAGKSILLDSLGLALGARADAGLVQPGADGASVTATFDLLASHPAWTILADAGVAASPETDSGLLLLRRAIGADGRSRAFVNDLPVSVALLKAVGDSVAEVHGQFEQHGLLNPARHREILDAAGGLIAAAVRVQGCWAAWRAAAEALADAETRAAAARRDEDFLRHATEELRRLAVEPGEEERLADERAFQMGRGRLIDALNTALKAMQDMNGANALAKSERALARVAEAAEGRFDGALAALERASIEFGEAERALNDAAQALEADSGNQEMTEERLFEIRDMARKHNVPAGALPELLEKLERDLDLIDRADGQIAELKIAAAAAEAEYKKTAETLSKDRRAAAATLAKAAMRELPPLRLERAELVVEVEPLEPSGWGPSGMDRVRFLARANPGQAFGAMHKVASGGELARFALALRVVLAASGSATALVFDEVDAGVGGATAAAVGERLRRLSETVQALVVTHSPQVAALGRRHFRVAKHEVEGRVASTVTELKGEARREEIARMLSGAAVTAEARAQADRLLEEA